MDDLHVVLLVEDNANDEMLALRVLKKSKVPLRVDVARDGQEAEEYLFDPNRPLPDLVLLDLKLPRINGIEVLKRVRLDERTRLLPVVIFTSSNQQADVQGGIACGANSFVRKSVEFADYTDRILKIAEYWLEINEPCDPALPKAIKPPVASAIPS
jgi:CheY-like chemotaxis protein